MQSGTEKNKMIRLCTLEDVDKLREIAIETYRETFKHASNEEDLQKFFNDSYSIKKLSSEIEDVNSETYFYEKDNKILAYLKINISTSQTEDMGEEYLEIQRIYVRKSAKGQGIGQKIMKFAEELAQEKGKKKIWLGVWENNFAAQKFYEKQGFKKTGEHDFIVGEQIDTDWIMEKSL